MSFTISKDGNSANRKAGHRPGSFFKQFTADQIRYAIAANAPETPRFRIYLERFPSPLQQRTLGKYGNLVNRTLVFAQNNCERKIPELKHLQEQDQQFLIKSRTCQRSRRSLCPFRLRRASQMLMELAQLGNVYFDAKKPWIAARSALTHRTWQTRSPAASNALRCSL